MVRIEGVEKNSPAYKKGIMQGDLLISIDGNIIKDVLDYRFYLVNKIITLKLERDGESFEVTIKKGEYQDIGLEFATYLMDEKKSCHNKCVFCFIDQLPRGMRDTLYFKDDDSRLSFLMGNYITMTNLKDEDIDRIIKMKMSPVNISVHTTNPELRCRMMNNRFAGDVLEKIDRLAKGGITMNCQIVCCKGLNDKKELDRSMEELSGFYPAVNSVSIVPAGITEHREGLYPLEPFTPEECVEIVMQVEKYADRCLNEKGSRIFYCADELYVKGGLSLPDEERYEGFPQIENGVGMITSMKTEIDVSFPYLSEDYNVTKARTVSVATGVAAYDFILSQCKRIEEACPNTKINVYKVENKFFGKNITVAGLLTGCDLIDRLKGEELGEKVILPSSMLRSEGDLTLDGMTKEDIMKALGTKVVFADCDGDSFLGAILG